MTSKDLRAMQSAMISLPEGITILVVEDEPGHARLIEIVLRDSGVNNDIINIQNGTEAMEFIFREGRYTNGSRPDKLLVLLDLNLPGTHGYSILKRIRDEDETSQLPVIVVTSSDDPLEMEKCHGMGCNDFLVKPPAASDLERAFRNAGYGE